MTNPLDTALDVLGSAAARLVRGDGNAAPHPLPSAPRFPPAAPPGRPGRWGFAHYNVVIPELPEPHRFLACAVMIGQPGVAVFDADHAARQGGPVRTTTVAHGTAATAPERFRAYDRASECDLRSEHDLRFGDPAELTLQIDFPGARLRSAIADLELTLDPEPTWFTRSPVYNHLGLRTRFRGTVGSEAVSGTGTFEHAQLIAPGSWLGAPVPRPLKLPVDRFTYHVIALAPDTLLLLTEVRGFGRAAACTVHLKSAPEDRSWGGLRLETAPAVRTLTAPDGRATEVPGAFHFTRGDLLELTGVPDTECIYGIGVGWIGGLRYTGHFRGQPVDARGYFEYIDCR